MLNEVETSNPLNIVLTGASSGIGLAAFRALMTCNVRIFTYGRAKPQIESTHFHHSALDLHLPVGHQLASAFIPESIDVLILAAGSDHGGRSHFAESHFSNWEQTLNVNFVRQLELLHYFLPRIIRSRLKKIIYITSTNLDRPPKGCVAYTAAKHGLSGALESLRLEYAPDELNIIEVRPGLTKTNFALNRWGDPLRAERFYKDSGPYLLPENLAEIIVDLIFNKKNPPPRIRILPSAQGPLVEELC